MTQRAFFASEGYFARDVARRKKSIAEFEESLAEAEANKGDTGLYLYQLFVRSYKFTVSAYSAGAPLDEVKQHFAHCLESLCAYQQSPSFSPLDLTDLEHYTYAVEVLALCLLCDAPRERFEAVVKVIEAAPKGAEAPRDFVLDYLVSCWDAAREPVATLLHAAPYQALKDVCEAANDEDRLLAVLHFLECYRADTEALPWSESHLTDDGQYFGFWSFALAAVVQDLGLDDTAFAMNLLYPADLVKEREPAKPIDVPPVDIKPPEITKPTMDVGVSLDEA